MRVITYCDKVIRGRLLESGADSNNVSVTSLVYDASTNYTRHSVT